MIGSNALAAFAQAIAPSPAQPVRAVQSALGAAAQSAGTAAQRTLEAVPPPPSQPLPRGSLLDLRV